MADGVWVVRGADSYLQPSNGGAVANIGIVATPAGAVLFDCGPSLRYGEQLRAVAEKLVGRPVARVWLSHLHPDHVYASLAFPENVVAATPALIAELRAQGPGFSDGMYRVLGDWMRGTDFRIPTTAVTGDAETIGGRRFRLLALGGHGGSDLAVLDEASGTLFAGDLVFHDRAPTTPHADLPRWRESLTALKALGHRRVVPGHGPVDPTPTAAIDQTRDWLDWLEAALTDAAARGLDMTEAGNIPVPARFARMAVARYEIERSVAHLYPGLEQRVLPALSGR